MHRKVQGARPITAPARIGAPAFAKASSDSFRVCVRIRPESEAEKQGASRKVCVAFGCCWMRSPRLSFHGLLPVVKGSEGKTRRVFEEIVYLFPN